MKVYDSMHTGDLCPNGKEAIASLVKTTRTYFSMTFPDVQQQDGGFNCGLYALDFGYSLCAGTDPAQLVYIQTEFRSHFLRCLMKEEVTDFPHDAIMKFPGKSLLRMYVGVRYFACANCQILEMPWFNVQSARSGITSHV